MSYFCIVVKKIWNLLTFFVLAALLLLNGTSREYIHTFSGHHDTIDHFCRSNHTDHHAAFDSEHHHCDFLQYVTPVYQSTAENFQLFFFKEEITSSFFWLPESFIEESKHTSLRGPPTKYS